MPSDDKPNEAKCSECGRTKHEPGQSEFSDCGESEISHGRDYDFEFEHDTRGNR